MGGPQGVNSLVWPLIGSYQVATRPQCIVVHFEYASYKGTVFRHLYERLAIDARPYVSKLYKINFDMVRRCLRYRCVLCVMFSENCGWVDVR